VKIPLKVVKMTEKMTGKKKRQVMFMLAYVL